jgi:hypothetical protein
MRNGCAADVWGLRGLAPVVALHTPHRADACFRLAPSLPRGICRNAPTERPRCAVKSLPCAWKFRLRISTHTTAPLSFAGELFKPLNGGGQPSRCERAERSGDHVRRRPQRDCSWGNRLVRGACPCRSRGAQRYLLHRSDFGIRASQTPSPSRGAQRCLSQRGGD